MKLIVKNKRAYFDYEFSKTYEAGIVLKWHEVKSIKENHVNINDSFARISEWEVWLYNIDIPLYNKTSPNLVPGYDPKCKRKLLMNKKELAKISAELDKPGNVFKPLEVYILKNGRIKVKLWIGKLKRKVEKKQIIKEKDQERQMKRDIRNYM